MPDRPRHREFRLDFQFVPVRNDDGTVTVGSVPDPDRYEWSTDSAENVFSWTALTIWHFHFM